MLRNKIIKIKQFIKNNYLILILVILIIIVTVLQFMLLQASRKNAGTFIEVSHVSSPPPIPKTTPTPSSSPTPISLPQGKGVYSVSQGKHQGPSISQVTFDPLDVRKGQKLTITIKATDQTPVTSVTATLQTDSTQNELVFKQVSDTSTSDWETSIKIDDTLWYRYILTIKATSSNGTTEVIVAPR